MEKNDADKVIKFTAGTEEDRKKAGKFATGM